MVAQMHASNISVMDGSVYIQYAGRYQYIMPIGGSIYDISSIYVLVHHKDMLYGINTEDSDSGSLLLLTSTISLLAKIKEDASGSHQASYR